MNAHLGGRLVGEVNAMLALPDEADDWAYREFAPAPSFQPVVKHIRSAGYAFLNEVEARTSARWVYCAHLRPAVTS